MQLQRDAHSDGFTGAASQPDALCLIKLLVDDVSQGVLIVSADERVCYYNAAYARLRQISPGNLIGRPLEELDRRQGVRILLRSGARPAEPPPPRERRRFEELLLPLWDAGQMLGVGVIVTPAAQAPPSGQSSLPPLRRGSSRDESSWQSQFTFADIIGDSSPLLQVRALAWQASQRNVSVLLVGESGTGKELFAHAIHAASSRASGPFVPVDCSAIPRELLEAELFGYAPGAFTGAAKEGKPGQFELADGGTIFLDEVGEMPLDMQAKLLRVLQERRILRVGGVSPIPVTVAVIAATNQDLESTVAQGRFRRDLFYRLDVVRIEVPPLRERPEDIPRLVHYYWERRSLELGGEATLSAEAMRMLEGYGWPGNVRELVNVIERLLIGVPKPVIEPEDLPPQFRRGMATPAGHFPTFHLQTILTDTERRALARALRHAHGNRSKAAQLVGLSRTSFYRKLKAHGLLTDEEDGTSELPSPRHDN